MKMGVAKACHLRQMGDDNDLMPRMAGQTPQLAADDHTDTAANALVNLVKNQGGGLIRLCQHRFERQHEPRCFATAGDFGHRLERLAGVGANQKFDHINARMVKSEPFLAHIGSCFGRLGGLAGEVYAKFGRHLQVAQLFFDAFGQLFGRLLPLVGESHGRLPHLFEPFVNLFEQFFNALLAVFDIV